MAACKLNPLIDPQWRFLDRFSSSALPDSSRRDWRHRISGTRAPTMRSDISPFRAAQMADAVLERIAGADIFIGVAAVSDYTPEVTHEHKVKKSDTPMTLKLKPTVDILATSRPARTRRSASDLRPRAMTSSSKPRKSAGARNCHPGHQSRAGCARERFEMKSRCLTMPALIRRRRWTSLLWHDGLLAG